MNSKREEFPGLGLKETLTERKRRICIDSLMKYMRDKYNTPKAVVSYVLERLNATIRKKGESISRLAKICFLDDYCSEGETPRDYLRAILNGTKDLQYPVLDRLNCQLCIRSDNLFPFKRQLGKPSSVAEYVLFPAA